jgi:ABC-type dipeptide/oligopeptide/nickel transport system ATPase component
LLEISELRTWFESPSGLVKAVDGVSIEVGAGQAVGVVGESGSGKTQTFFSVFGLSRGRPGVVSGRARFDDVDILTTLDDYVAFPPDTASLASASTVTKRVEQWDAIQRKRLAPILGHSVALLFQEPRQSLIPYWTVGRHLEEVLNRSGLRADECVEALATLGFRQPRRVMERFPAQLSGGEAQRVMLALSVAIRPRLLVADEPTTALDALNEAKVLREIQRLHQDEGIAIVIISHDLAVVGLIAEYVFVMYGGHVVERAPIHSLLGGGEGECYHPYTQELRASQRRRASGRFEASDPGVQRSVTGATGCPYAHRCAVRAKLSSAEQDRCRDERPPSVEVGSRHVVSCWKASS